MTEARTPNDLVLQFTKSMTGPAGQKIKVIDLHSLRLISQIAGISPRRVEILSLELGMIPLRYLRNIGTIGIDGQAKLLGSTVAICGAGGLGGTAVELLARMGTGHLVIIDRGKFVENNLNRQILATEADIGKSKVKIAAERVRSINSAVSVTKVNKSIERDNVLDIIKNADVVIDALDSVTTRRIVADACAKLRIPLVHGAIAGFCGQIGSILPGDKGIDSVYEDSLKEGDCGIEAVTGNPSATPAVVAAWQVQEAVKIITGIGSPIRHRLLFLDFAEGSVDEISLRP
jgi:molybdopterin-synthase adenylyltransferase